MNYAKYRKEMYVAVLGTDEHDTGKIVKILASVGYQITVFSDDGALFESLVQGPPHIVIFDVTHYDSEAVSSVIRKLKDLSPETLFVLLVPQLYQYRIQEELNAVYDIITRPVVSAEILRPVDRATERIIMQYRIEDLQAELEEHRRSGTPPHTNSAKSEGAESQFQLQAYSLVRDFLTEIGEKRDLMGIIQRYVDRVSHLLGDRPVIYFKYMKYKFSLAVAATANIPLDSVRGVGLKFRGFTPQQQQDLLREPEKASQLALLIKEGFSQNEFYATPLIFGSEVAGIFVFLVGELDSQQSKIVRFLTNLLELVCDRNRLELRLHTLSVYDEVTQVFSKKYFDDLLVQEVIRARRTQLPLSVIRIEVDQYGYYGDKYGVATGDIIMQVVAVILRNTSRGNDIVARTGRAEFSLLLPYTHAHGAAVRAERLRRAVEKARFPTLQDLLDRPITLSLGVSEYPSIGEDAESIFRQAGDALDQVRHNSGNKVCLAAVIAGHQPDFSVEV